MACSSCRKAPKIIRKPSIVTPESTGAKREKNISQREKITGLRYVPKA